MIVDRLEARVLGAFIFRVLVRGMYRSSVSGGELFHVAGLAIRGQELDREGLGGVGEDPHRTVWLTGRQREWQARNNQKGGQAL